ncbi:HAMP domain-containing histidine kinase [Streptomyces actuosus]|uniref:histidine kinase n=1 Tax=Streptomyces actuosus TaxID=1885 RepID=A0ABS2VR53_STRAS|nr:HAMP domain-containing sensor histidine kinase [Streptomyces actuosus]MBN0045465.1 HAMP domain-containing histidine kinase [Streptomyces actuosus]
MRPDRIRGPRRRRPGLAGELVLLTAAVTTVTVLLTGLVAWHTLRGAAEAQERDQLARQAKVLGRVPALSALLYAGEQRIAGANGVELAVLDRSGVLSGPAAPVLSTAQRDVLLSGKSLSSSGELHGTEVLVEGSPARYGGAVVLTRPLTDVDAAVARMRRDLLLPLTAGLVGAVVAGTALARRLARPLSRAAETASELAAGRRGVADPDPAASPGPAEAVRLRQALSVLDAALERGERQQRDFLLSISHEIRTPLTSVLGYAEALADDAVPTHRLPEVGRILQAEARRLDRFLGDLLDLARLEADDFRLDLAAVDLTLLVREAAATWGERCARHHVDFRLEHPGRAVVVRTDGFRVRQLADCLLANALRLTPQGNPVVLALRAGDDEVEVEVRDSGPGLTDDDVKVAFERGALHERYRDLRPVGTGLGLAIAHRLAARLGGTLTAGTEGPEGGAVFTLRLPTDDSGAADRRTTHGPDGRATDAADGHGGEGSRPDGAPPPDTRA